MKNERPKHKAGPVLYYDQQILYKACLSGILVMRNIFKIVSRIEYNF